MSQSITPSELPEIRETQVHILIGCADARDVGQVHIDAVTATQKRYRERGIHAHFHVIRVPGSFVTEDVLADVRRIVALSEAENYRADAPPQYFAYVQVHGALSDSGIEGCYTGTTPSLRIEQGSPLNCGMLGATGVAMEIEELLLLLHPTFPLHNGKTLRIGDENDIRTLLREVYDYDGFFAGDWVRSIDDLRTHARAQKAVLERAIAHDPELRRLEMHVSAGIQDYKHHRTVRLDCGETDLHFWDEVQDFIYARFQEAGKDDPDFAAQSERQKPLAGLFAMDDPTASPRDRAALWYAKRRNLPDTEYRPNLLFTLGGSAFDHPRTPFGPYVVAGFFYGAKHLGLEEFVVVGHDTAQTQRMIAKIHNDPLMAFIVEQLGVKLLPVNAAEL
jgi:hypothetical protein